MIKRTSKNTHKMPKKKIEGEKTSVEVKVKAVESKPDKVEIDRSTLEAMQEQIKMLVEVADKGRVLNYESQKGGKKPMEVQLSRYMDGYIIGWRTVKDELVKHPTTGAIVGEQQEYEMIILGDDGEPRKVSVSGYSQFSNARYDTRVTCEVISKKEDFNGNLTFGLRLPDNKLIEVDSRFIN